MWQLVSSNVMEVGGGQTLPWVSTLLQVRSLVELKRDRGTA